VIILSQLCFRFIKFREKLHSIEEKYFPGALHILHIGDLWSGFYPNFDCIYF